MFYTFLALVSKGPLRLRTLSHVAAEEVHRLRRKFVQLKQVCCRKQLSHVAGPHTSCVSKLNEIEEDRNMNFPLEFPSDI